MPAARPAVRLMKTAGLSRDAWLAVRRTGIGGSDAAAAVGLSPYMSQLELWMIKTGRDASLARPDASDTAEPVYWGTLLEPAVATAYALKTGNRVRRINAVLQHASVPFMLANLDREVLGSRDVQILECKTAAEFGARLWNDGVPEYVQLQVQHQLAVSGKQAADVAVLLNGQRLEVHRIERDDKLIYRLIELEARFWHFVTSDTPPPVDGTDSAERALRHLFPTDNGATQDFSENRRLSSVFADLVSVRAEIEAREKTASALKQEIQLAMGEASRALFETGEVLYRRSKDSDAVDTDRLLAEHPDLRERYATTKAGSRRFLVRPE